MCSICGFLSRQSVFDNDIVAVVNIAPLGRGHFGIEDKVGVQSMFLCEADPIVLDLRLETVRFVPVGIEV